MKPIVQVELLQRGGRPRACRLWQMTKRGRRASQDNRGVNHRQHKWMKGKEGWREGGRERGKREGFRGGGAVAAKMEN